MNNRYALIFTLLLAVPFSTLPSLAQHDHSSTQAQNQDSGSTNVQECQKHFSEASAALDEAEASISKAKESSTPEDAKAALSLAETQIASAKHHLSMCPMASGHTDHGSMDQTEHEQHKMKCMSNDARPQ